MRPSFRAALAALALSSLACDTTFPWAATGAPSSPGGPTFELSSSSLQFTAVSGWATPPPQQVAVIVRGGPLYLTVASSGAAVASAVSDPARGTLTVSVPTPGAPGTLTGTVTVRAYLDAEHGREVAGSPRTLAVTYVVAPSDAPVISVAAGTSLSFTATAGRAAPPPRTFDVAIANGPVALQVTASGGATATIVSQTTTAATVEVAPPAPGATPGTTTGSVQVIGCPDAGCAQQVPGSPLVVPYTYTVATSRLAVEPAALAFEVVAGAGGSAPKALAVSDPGGSAPWTATVDYGGGTQGWLQLAPSSGGALPASIDVTVSFPSSAPAGDHRATVAVTSLGATRAVAVTATVSKPRIVSDPPRLAFAAVRNQSPLPPAQALALTTEHGGALTYAREVTYGPGATGWLSVPASGTAPGSLDVGVTTSALAPGRYTASIRLDPSSLAPPTSVEVTYDVAAPSLTATPAALTFAVDATTQPTALGAALALDAGGAPVTWTATPSQPWLSVSPASGTTPAAPVVSLLPAGLEAMPPGAHAASIVLRYQPAPGETATVDVPVDLDLDLPVVETVSPRVSVAGVGGEVIVRGAGLRAPFAGAVRFGGTAAASTEGVSTTELRVTPPALPAGSHPVVIDNALGLSRSRARLEVVAPATRAAAAIASPGAKAKIVFDDAARVLYVANTGTGKLERHREAASWIKATDGSDEVALTGLKNVALSPHGETLVAIAGTTFRLLDAATLTLALAQPSAAAPATANAHLEMTNAGKAIFVGQGATWSNVGALDLATGAATAVPAGTVYAASLAASADGSRVAAAESGITSPDVLVWHASTGTATRADLGYDGWFGALDRHATRLILFGAYNGAKARYESRLLDEALRVLGGTVPPRYAGTPPPGAAPATQAVLLSPLGRARAFTWDGTSVSCFDLEGALDASGVYLLLASAKPITSPGATARLTLAADERTAFLAGDAAVVIVPIECP